MAQNWTMIPLHIRCTERWKIDPNYPKDTARWWEMQEKADRLTRARKVGRPELSEFQKEVSAYVKEHSPVSAVNIARHFGVSCAKIHTAMLGAGAVDLIWESEHNGSVYYGYMHGGDN